MSSWNLRSAYPLLLAETAKTKLTLAIDTHHQKLIKLLMILIIN